jgi:hypothetical protein
MYRIIVNIKLHNDLAVDMIIYFYSGEHCNLGKSTTIFAYQTNGEKSEKVKIELAECNESNLDF